MTANLFKIYKKIICFLVFFAFSFNALNLQYCFGAVIEPNGVSNNKILVLNPVLENDLLLGVEYGRIIDSFKGTSDKKVIIVKDLHCNKEVQNNIVEILLAVGKKYQKNFSDILVEGAWDNLDLSLIKSFPDWYGIKNNFVNRFLDNGVFTGAEKYVAFNWNKNLIGIENREAYEQNFNTLVNSFEKRKDANVFIGELMRKIAFYKKQIYSQNLRNIDEIVFKYRTSKITAVEYFEKLKEYSQRAGFLFDMEAPTLEKFYQSEKIKQKIGNLKFVQMEAEDLESDLIRSLSKDEFNELSSLRMKNNSKYYFYLQKLCLERKLDIANKYDVLNMYFDYLNFSSSIDTTKILQEEKNVLFKINTFFATRTNEKTLLKIEQILDTYYRFVNNLALNEETLDIILNNEEYISLIKKFVSENSSDIVWLYSLKTSFGKFKQAIEIMKDFYVGANERNNYFVENILKNVNKPQNGSNNVFVVVLGGYHTRDVSLMLKDKNISYLVISPNITKNTDNNLYDSLLLSQSVTFERNDKLALISAFQNKVLTDEELGKLAETLTAGQTQDKLIELAEIAKKEKAKKGKVVGRLSVDDFKDIELQEIELKEIWSVLISEGFIDERGNISVIFDNLKKVFDENKSLKEDLDEKLKNKQKAIFDKIQKLRDEKQNILDKIEIKISALVDTEIERQIAEELEKKKADIEKVQKEELEKQLEAEVDKIFARESIKTDILRRIQQEKEKQERGEDSEIEDEVKKKLEEQIEQAIAQGMSKKELFVIQDNDPELKKMLAEEQEKQRRGYDPAIEADVQDKINKKIKEEIDAKIQNIQVTNVEIDKEKARQLAGEDENIEKLVDEALQRIIKNAVDIRLQAERTQLENELKQLNKQLENNIPQDRIALDKKIKKLNKKIENLDRDRRATIEKEEKNKIDTAERRLTERQKIITTEKIIEKLKTKKKAKIAKEIREYYENKVEEEGYTAQLSYGEEMEIEKMRREAIEASTKLKEDIKANLIAKKKEKAEKELRQKLTESMEKNKATIRRELLYGRVSKKDFEGLGFTSTKIVEDLINRGYVGLDGTVLIAFEAEEDIALNVTFKNKKSDIFRILQSKRNNANIQNLRTKIEDQLKKEIKQKVEAEIAEWAMPADVVKRREQKEKILKEAQNKIRANIDTVSQRESIRKSLSTDAILRGLGGISDEDKILILKTLEEKKVMRRAEKLASFVDQQQDQVKLFEKINSLIPEVVNLEREAGNAEENLKTIEAETAEISRLKKEIKAEKTFVKLRKTKKQRLKNLEKQLKKAKEDYENKLKAPRETAKLARKEANNKKIKQITDLTPEQMQKYFFIYVFLLELEKASANLSVDQIRTFVEEMQVNLAEFRLFATKPSFLESVDTDIIAYKILAEKLEGGAEVTYSAYLKTIEQNKINDVIQFKSKIQETAYLKLIAHILSEKLKTMKSIRVGQDTKLTPEDIANAMLLKDKTGEYQKVFGDVADKVAEILSEKYKEHKDVGVDAKFAQQMAELLKGSKKEEHLTAYAYKILFKDTDLSDKSIQEEAKLLKGSKNKIHRRAYAKILADNIKKKHDEKKSITADEIMDAIECLKTSKIEAEIEAYKVAMATRIIEKFKNEYAVISKQDKEDLKLLIGNDEFIQQARAVLDLAQKEQYLAIQARVAKTQAEKMEIQQKQEELKNRQEESSKAQVEAERLKLEEEERKKQAEAQSPEAIAKQKLEQERLKKEQEEIANKKKADAEELAKQKKAQELEIERLRRQAIDVQLANIRSRIRAFGDNRTEGKVDQERDLEAEDQYVGAIKSITFTGNHYYYASPAESYVVGDCGLYAVKRLLKHLGNPASQYSIQYLRFLTADVTGDPEYADTKKWLTTDAIRKLLIRLGVAKENIQFADSFGNRINENASLGSDVEAIEQRYKQLEQLEKSLPEAITPTVKYKLDEYTRKAFEIWLANKPSANGFIEEFQNIQKLIIAEISKNSEVELLIFLDGNKFDFAVEQSWIEIDISGQDLSSIALPHGKDWMGRKIKFTGNIKVEEQYKLQAIFFEALTNHGEVVLVEDIQEKPVNLRFGQFNHLNITNSQDSAIASMLVAMLTPSMTLTLQDKKTPEKIELINILMTSSNLQDFVNFFKGLKVGDGINLSMEHILKIMTEKFQYESKKYFKINSQNSLDSMIAQNNGNIFPEDHTEMILKTDHFITISKVPNNDLYWISDSSKSDKIQKNQAELKIYLEELNKIQELEIRFFKASKDISSDSDAGLSSAVASLFEQMSKGSEQSGIANAISAGLSAIASSASSIFAPALPKTKQDALENNGEITTIQSAFKTFLAKKELKKVQIEKAKIEEQRLKENLAAIKIQKIVRGVKGRKIFEVEQQKKLEQEIKLVYDSSKLLAFLISQAQDLMGFEGQEELVDKILESAGNIANISKELAEKMGSNEEATLLIASVDSAMDAVSGMKDKASKEKKFFKKLFNNWVGKRSIIASKYILDNLKKYLNEQRLMIIGNKSEKFVSVSKYLSALDVELLNIFQAVSEQIQILKQEPPKPIQILKQESPKPRLEIQTKKVDQKALESPESPIPSSPVSPRLFSEPDSDSESITARLGEHSLKALNPLLISDAIERIDSDSIVSGRDIIQKLKASLPRKQGAENRIVILNTDESSVELINKDGIWYQTRRDIEIKKMLETITGGKYLDDLIEHENIEALKLAEILEQAKKDGKIISQEDAFLEAHRLTVLEMGEDKEEKFEKLYVLANRILDMQKYSTGAFDLTAGSELLEFMMDQNYEIEELYRADNVIKSKLKQKIFEAEIRSQEMILETEGLNYDGVLKKLELLGIKSAKDYADKTIVIRGDIAELATGSENMNDILKKLENLANIAKQNGGRIIFVAGETVLNRILAQEISTKLFAPMAFLNMTKGLVLTNGTFVNKKMYEYASKIYGAKFTQSTATKYINELVNLEFSIKTGVVDGIDENLIRKIKAVAGEKLENGIFQMLLDQQSKSYTEEEINVEIDGVMIKQFLISKQKIGEKIWKFATNVTDGLDGNTLKVVKTTETLTKTTVIKMAEINGTANLQLRACDTEQEIVEKAPEMILSAPMRVTAIDLGLAQRVVLEIAYKEKLLSENIVKFAGPILENILLPFIAKIRKEKGLKVDDILDMDSQRLLKDMASSA